jgi:thiol-disulfide isomerase/thioredoxin
MPKPLQAGLIAAVAATALAVGVYVRLDDRTGAAPPDDSAVLALTQASFKDLSDQVGSLEQWRGRVLVVNFWASWCPPCREEIPGLVDIQRQFAAKGVQVVGIAVDSAEKARESAGELGINYPVLVAGIEIVELTRRLGNRPGALPYTLVLDRNGKLVAQHLGIIPTAELTRIVTPLIG